MKSHRRFLSIVFVSLFASTAFSASDPDHPTNAAAFLARVVSRDSGGAGHGGNAMLSDYFRSYELGAAKLALTLGTGGDEELKAIRAGASEVRVFPVDFRLCDDPKSAGCDPAKAYPAKGYADGKIVLVDARSEAESWTSLSIYDQRARALESIAAALGVTISDLDLRVHEDDSAFIARVSAEADRLHYFRGLNDYFFGLPSASEGDLAGEWSRTVIAPAKGAVALAPAADPAELPTSVATVKWKGDVKATFSPSFGVEMKRVAEFECKLVAADRALCRDLRDGATGYMFAQRDVSNRK